MRAQAMENLLIEFEKTVDNIDEYDNSVDSIFASSLLTLRNLSTKSKILRNRSNVSTSVLKELANR